MNTSIDFIEQRIIKAVHKLLTGKVNEILNEAQFYIPAVEFGNYESKDIVTPIITLKTCERSEKERIIRQDAYSLTITYSFQETPESQLYCYAHAAAIDNALKENTTLGGIADRAVMTERKYLSSKKPNDGEGWGLVISLRITIGEC